MNESFKTDPSLATSARAAKESGSYLCASNVTPTAVRFIVSVFLCLLCSCRMSSTQMTCSHFRKNRPKKRQKPSGCRSRIISKNRPVPIFGRSTGASLVESECKQTGQKIGYGQKIGFVYYDLQLGLCDMDKKYKSRFFDFFFDFDFNHDFDTNRHALSHILLVFAHLVLHFSLFYYTFYSLFLFFTYIYIYIYIYALVWCYFYIIFILCTVQ